MEILDLTNEVKDFKTTIVIHSNEYFALAYRKTAQYPFAIILGTYCLKLEYNSTLISCESLETLHNRNQELFDFLLYDRDISLWNEDFIFYMILKFDLVRE